jgi:ATP-dependent RNA helicase DeaD
MDLKARGFLVDELHGDLSQAKREAVMKKFREAKLQLLIATDVAARGLDVEGVTHVFNYDIPQDVESYIHRIGRTGRAGKDGLAITFVALKDKQALEIIEKGIERSLPRREVDVQPADGGHNSTRSNEKSESVKERKEKNIQASRERSAKGGRGRRSSGGPGRVSSSGRGASNRPAGRNSSGKPGESSRRSTAKSESRSSDGRGSSSASRRSGSGNRDRSGGRSRSSASGSGGRRGRN